MTHDHSFPNSSTSPAPPESLPTDAPNSAVVDHFFAALAARCPDGPDGPESRALADAMRSRRAELFERHRRWISDEPSRDNLAVVTAVLAAYVELSARGEHDQDEVVAALTAAFVEPLAEATLTGTAAALDAAPDPFALMVRICKEREVDAFGDGFAFDRAVDDGDEYLADVRRCFFHEVLAAEDAAHLTPVMCAWDGNWLDAVRPERHGFRADRRTSIGLGGASCPFRFRRTTGEAHSATGEVRRTAGEDGTGEDGG